MNKQRIVWIIILRRGIFRSTVADRASSLVSIASKQKTDLLKRHDIGDKDFWCRFIPAETGAAALAGRHFLPAHR